MEILYSPTVTLILGALCLTIGFVTRSFLSGYFREFGKNIATHQDISNLTEKVEEVKNKYIQENTKISADLNFLISKQSTLFNEEKISILNFYNSYNKWFWISLRIKIHKYDFDNYNIMLEHINRIEQYYAEVNMAKGNLEIFCKNEDIIDCATSLMTETLKLHDLVDSYLLNFQPLIRDGNYYYRTIELFRSNPSNGDLIKILGSELERLNNLRIDFIKDYPTKFKELIGPIVLRGTEFQELVKLHLPNM